MLNDYMGIINLTEDESKMRSLVYRRPLGSIPIGGRYRVIDYVLSNMVNAGISNVGIFSQSKSRSLVDHLGSGKPWDLDRKISGLFVFNFGLAGEYLHDIEMFKNNIEYFYNSVHKNILMSPSYMICNIDYNSAVKYHEESGMDITVIYKKIDNADRSFIDCDVLNINDKGRLLSVGKNIGSQKNQNISMEMFIMKKSVFMKLLYKCIETGFCRNMKDAIYQSVNELNINTYEFKGYLECINTIDAYYTANMDMLDTKVTRELYSQYGPVYTKVKDESPTKYTDDCKVSNSLIANGCIIDGNVKNSIIARRVIISKGAEVNNCIIMQSCHIGEAAKLSNVILDKNVIIEKNKELKGDAEFPLVVQKKLFFNTPPKE